MRVCAGVISFVGCYKNEEGAQRLTYDDADIPLSYCAQTAKNAGKPYFGMEYPQGYKIDGNAECLLLDFLPQQSKTTDTECAAKKDRAGNLLGSEYRLAAYTLGAYTPPCTSVHPLTDPRIPPTSLHSQLIPHNVTQYYWGPLGCMVVRVWI